MTLASSRKISAPLQAVGRHLEAALDLDARAEPLQRVDVRIEPAPADHVAARRRHACAAESRQQRAGEQERRSDPLGENRVDLGRRQPTRIDAHLVRPGPLGARASGTQQLEHRLDVADARDVGERDRLAGEQARGEDRQRAVLVPGSANAAVERVSTLDDESVLRCRDGHAGLG